MQWDMCNRLHTGLLVREGCPWCSVSISNCIKSHTHRTSRLAAGDRDENGLENRDENGLENLLTIPFPLFFGRERDRERESRTGKRNQYYRISEIEYFDREYVIDRKSVIYNGNTIMTTWYIKLDEIATPKYILEASPHQRWLKCDTNISPRRLITYLLHQMVHHRTTLRGNGQWSATIARITTKTQTIILTTKRSSESCAIRSFLQVTLSTGKIECRTGPLLNVLGNKVWVFLCKN